MTDAIYTAINLEIANQLSIINDILETTKCALEGIVRGNNPMKNRELAADALAYMHSRGFDLEPHTKRIESCARRLAS